MKEALLTAKEIVKTYPDRQEPILNRISIEIYQGDFTIIMGPSGAGKSTLLYALSGMDTLSSGKCCTGIRNWEPFRKKGWPHCGPGNLALCFNRHIW